MKAIKQYTIFYATYSLLQRLSLWGHSSQIYTVILHLDHTTEKPENY